MISKTIIFYAYINDFLNSDFENTDFTLLQNSLPYSISDCKNTNEKHLSLLGRSLLVKGLSYFGYDKSEITKIKYTGMGKPYITCSENFINFNISHSKGIVLCAISNISKLGIDVEHINKTNPYNFKNHFTKTEWGIMENHENPISSFYEYWTKKEAILKATGNGITGPLSNVAIQNDNTCFFNNIIWYLHVLNINKDYCTTLATDKNIPFTLKHIIYK